MKSKGFPKLMVKFKEAIMLPISQQPNTFDSKLETSKELDYVQMTLHKEYRARFDDECDFAGYQLAGGREYCGIYIGVECQEDEIMCGYKINLELLEWTEDVSATFQEEDEEENRNKIPVSPYPPRYIPKD
jgi:hypothetical protein